MVATTKRGQAASAAVLIAVIAALIIGFIVLIPPADRAELLGEEVTTTSSSDDDLEESVVDKNLLSVDPGRIDYLAQREIEHPLPVVNIYTRTESKVLAEKNLAYIKKGVFSEENTEFSFSIPDLQHTEDVLLSLSVEDLEGRLIVTLNGEEVYNAEAVKGPIRPIALSKNLLQQQNVLTFAVSSPGIAFWATNEGILKDLKIVADVTSVEAQSSRNTFLISETEKKNLEKVVLRFQPECKYGEAGKLSITINGEEIYNGLPDCDLAMIPIEFSAGSVYQGENRIIFYTERGTYLLSHVSIESELKELEFPTYYFELSHEEYEDVMDETRRVRLQMDFVDVVTRKRGDLVFNGHLDHFDTKEVSYTVDLSEDVVRGNNALKIKPKKTLEVRELKIDLIK